MRWPAVREGYVIPAVWFCNASFTCCLFPPALVVGHPVHFALSDVSSFRKSSRINRIV
jgi:hypothetical protein